MKNTESQNGGVGSLSDLQIEKLIKNGLFTKKTLKYVAVGPASVDVSSTTEMYRIEKNIIPQGNKSVRSLLKEMGAVKHNVANPLEREVQYICCVGKINIPKGLYAFGNAKSSSGRIDLHVRLLADGLHTFDTVTSGEKEIWLHISPHSFSVICADNTPLLQIRFFNADTRMKVPEVIELNENRKKNDKIFSYSQKNTINKNLSWDICSTLSQSDILLSLNVPKKGIVGYKAKNTNKVLDLSKRDYLVEDFFIPIYSTDEKIELDKDGFYILSTREYINIPEDFAGEMIANDPRLGEFRTHYAGFFDPGFEGEGVLEVRPNENILFWHGQPMVPFRLERMAQLPKNSYKVGHNYFGQTGPRLAKFFKQK